MLEKETTIVPCHVHLLGVLSNHHPHDPQNIATTQLNPPLATQPARSPSCSGAADPADAHQRAAGGAPDCDDAVLLACGARRSGKRRAMRVLVVGQLHEHEAQ
eukprot:72275-Chlamydomonas_euryale.AAC.2